MFHTRDDAFVGVDTFKSAQVTQTAGSTAAVNGIEKNRIDYHSANIVVATSATLAQDETATFTLILQHRTDSTDSWTTYKTLGTDVDAGTGGTGGSTETNAFSYTADLHEAKAEIRSVLTPTLSAADTDTILITTLTQLSGSRVIPTS